jgi:hypothetical protein
VAGISWAVISKPEQHWSGDALTRFSSNKCSVFEPIIAAKFLPPPTSLLFLLSNSWRKNRVKEVFAKTYNSVYCLVVFSDDGSIEGYIPSNKTDLDVGFTPTQKSGSVPSPKHRPEGNPHPSGFLFQLTG